MISGVGYVVIIQWSVQFDVSEIITVRFIIVSFLKYFVVIFTCVLCNKKGISVC